MLRTSVSAVQRRANVGHRVSVRRSSTIVASCRSNESRHGPSFVANWIRSTCKATEPVYARLRGRSPPRVRVMAQPDASGTTLVTALTIRSGLMTASWSAPSSRPNRVNSDARE